MPSLGTAYVRVLANLKGLKPGLDQAKNIVSTSATKMRASLNQIAFTTAIAGAAAFSAAMVYNMKKAVDAASDLEEVAAKFGTVFKDQIVYAEKNAKALVESYGVSTRAAKEYLSSMQDLLVPMGMASNSAAVLSNEVVKLGIDLGSFNNMPTERVMLDIQSALVGNFETMKKYGVVLNAQVVAQEAMNMGLVESKDQLTAGLKAQAAYSLMVKGSEAAIGDWARTSGGFANQMKQLTSNIEEIRAELGNNLLPIITPIVDNMNKWIKANKEILAQDMKGWVEGVVEMLKWGAKPLQLWADLWKEIGFIVGSAGPSGTTLKGFAAANPPQIGDGKTGYPPILPPDAGGGMGGGVGVGADVTADDLALKLQLEEEYGLSVQELRQAEMDALVSSQEYKLAATQDYHDQAIGLLIDKNSKEVELALKQQAMLAKVDEQTANAKISVARGLGTALLNISGASSQAIFLVTQGLDMALAIMSGYAAGARALAELGPIAGPPVAAKMVSYGYWSAAAIGATALGQMAASSAGGSVGGGTYISPTVTTPTGTTEYDTIPEEEKRGTLTINIHGDILGDEGYIDMLVDKINAADDRDVFINQSLSARALT